jgi:hypothetical protein
MNNAQGARVALYARCAPGVGSLVDGVDGEGDGGVLAMNLRW